MLKVLRGATNRSDIIKGMFLFFSPESRFIAIKSHKIYYSIAIFHFR